MGLRPRLSDPTFLVLYLLPSSPMGYLHCEYFLCIRLGNRCVPELLRVLRSFEGDPADPQFFLTTGVGCSVTSRSGWRAPGSSNSSNAPIFGSRPGSHCSCPGVLVPARVNGFCSFPLRRSRSRGCRRQGGAAPEGPRMAGNGARASSDANWPVVGFLSIATVNLSRRHA